MKYENFSDNVQLFHLEYNILGSSLIEDANNMKKLNVNIFSIDPYNKYDANENNLKDSLIEMKKYLV